MSIVADGGPSEQSAIQHLAGTYFPNCNLATRDRCHRTRSMLKGAWQPLNEMCSHLLGIFTTEEQSLSRMMKSPGRKRFYFNKFKLLFSYCKAYRTELLWQGTLPSIPRSFRNASYRWALVFPKQFAISALHCSAGTACPCLC